MNEERKKKLEKAKLSKAGEKMLIVSNGKEFIEAIGEKIEQLSSVLGEGTEINNLDEIISQLEVVAGLDEPIRELKATIAEMIFPEIPGNIKIEGITQLAEQIKRLKYQKVEIDWLNEDNFKSLLKRFDALEKAIGQKIYFSNNQPDEFIPIRRVIDLNKGAGHPRFIFDDSFGMGGGGGGGAAATPTIMSQPISQSGAGTTAIVGAVADKRIKVVSYVVVMAAAGTFKFTSGSTDLTGAMDTASNSGAAIGNEFAPLLVCGVNETLSLVTTGAKGNGHLSYFLE